MKRVIPREKLSKKARKELDAKARSLWLIHPATRCPPSSKVYNRNKARKESRIQFFSELCSSYTNPDSTLILKEEII